jgi:hypothetical protein
MLGAMKLTKSQRVKVIQDVANHLRPEGWTNIDLVLKQFGFPTSDEWQGDTSAYVVKMIEDAKDDDLIELGQHFGMEFDGKDPLNVLSNDTKYWQDGQLKVFISHLTEHKKQAADLKTVMQRYGMSGFVAHNDINPTAEWQIEIETALATCDLLVALLHPGFAESKWCDQETGYALGRGIPVFAVSCGADPHGFVSRFQAFSGNGKDPLQIAREIFRASIDHKKLQDKMADAVVNLFVTSGSFAAAKERIGHVELLKIWDPSYSGRIQKALKQNDQIYGSWDVPERVKKLLAKWK